MVVVAAAAAAAESLNEGPCYMKREDEEEE